MNVPVGAIILAAGASSRLARPKQLVEYGGTTLLQRAIDIATQAGCSEIVVVLGAHADRIAQALRIKIDSVEDALKCIDSCCDRVDCSSRVTRLTFVDNPRWSEGQSTSLFVGVTVMAQTNVKAAMIMLCDQPKIEAADLQKLVIAQSRSSGGIAASAYADTVGVPACFDRTHFAELLDLIGDCGAKALLKKYAAAVISVAIPSAKIDIDTQTDIASLSNT